MSRKKDYFSSYGSKEWIKIYKFKVIKKSAWCIAISTAPARAFFVSSDM